MTQNVQDIERKGSNADHICPHSMDDIDNQLDHVFKSDSPVQLSKRMKGSKQPKVG